MADTFPIDVAQIVALFLESVFYGLYLVTVGMCIHTFFFRAKSAASLRYPLMSVALALFIIATLDEALLLRHILDAFIYYKGQGGAQEEFANISYWVNVMKTVTYVAQTSIADGMLIYRCYIIYSKNWQVPAGLSLLWFAGMACEGYTCFVEFTLHSNANLNTAQLGPFITAFVVITLLLNVLATSLIAYRIWQVQQRQADLFVVSGGGGRGGGALNRAMRIIIESGAMYCVSVFVFFVVHLVSNNSQYGVSDCVVQVIGIAFNLIIIRIDQGRTAETLYATELTSYGSSASSAGRGGILGPKLRFAAPKSSTKASSQADKTSKVPTIVARPPYSQELIAISGESPSGGRDVETGASDRESF